MKSKFFSSAVIGIAVLSLTACVGMELQKARDTSAAGSLYFDKALYKEYLAQATDEFNEGDYGNSDIFAKRAIGAASNNSPGPEALRARTLPAGTSGDLAKARLALLAAYRKGAKEKIPDQAARAQVMFDCWMEEQEENIQPKDIAACRAAFDEAMKKVNAAVKEKMMAKPAPAPKPKPKAKPKPKMPEPFVVYFDFDKSSITEAGAGTIERAARAANKLGARLIAAAGHTDMAGTPKYNFFLSKRRVDAVAEALYKAGAAAGIVAKTVHGEESPDVKTADGKREWRNRRVTITLR